MVYWLVCYRGLISSTVEATSGVANRVYNWITSPFRAEPETKPEDDEDKEDEEGGANDGEAEPAEPEEETKPESQEEVKFEEIILDLPKLLQLLRVSQWMKRNDTMRI